MREFLGRSVGDEPKALPQQVRARPLTPLISLTRMSDFRPLMDVFTCVRPLIAINNDKQFPYSVLGSCFIADFYERYFVITAKHTYFKSYTVTQLAAQYDPKQARMLPFNRRFELLPHGGTDEELSDITILEIDADQLDIGSLGATYPAKITIDDSFTLLNPNFNYAFRGYPHQLREYSEKQIHSVGVTGDAFLLDGNLSDSGLHGLTVNNAEKFPSFDGFSGSPVFQLSHLDDIVTLPCFSGMLTRGNQRSGIVHFMTCKQIVKALQAIVKEHEIPPVKKI